MSGQAEPVACRGNPSARGTLLQSSFFQIPRESA